MDIRAKEKGPRNPHYQSENPISGIFVPKLSGGSARESNPPTLLVTRHNGFEVRKGHRAPSTPPNRG